MKNTEWSLQDAKNKFSAVVDVAMAGKPTVAVVSIEDLEKLQSFEMQQQPCFTDHLLNIPRDGKEFERQPVNLRDFP